MISEEIWERKGHKVSKVVKQFTLQHAEDVIKPWNVNNSSIQQMTCCLVETVAFDSQPLSVVGLCIH